jgi:peptidoglycan/LPS O-acetylase OafA/YrhL
METSVASLDASKTLPTRFDIIDILRGIAALCVAAAHIWGIMWAWQVSIVRRSWFTDFSQAPDLARAIGFPLSHFGWIGVSMFFAVSGFCIHYGYMRGREGSDSVSFMLRRVFRIFPAFLVSLFLIITVVHGIFRYQPAIHYGWMDIVGYASMLFNLFPNLPPINPVYWTLPIEFQLYVLYLLVLRFRNRLTLRSMLLWTLILEGSMHVLSFWLRWRYDVILNDTVIFLSPLAFWFDWMMGAYVAERLYKGMPLLPRWLLPTFTGLMVLAMVWLPAANFRYLIGAVFAALIIERFVQAEFRSRIARIFAWFGKISYSLYLWHLPILSIAVTIVLRNRVIENEPINKLGVLVLVLVIVVIPVSYLSYRYVELPGIAWGKKAASRYLAGKGK